MNGLNTETVLVPFDFSAMSFDAIRTAMQVVGRDGVVHVVHVMIDWFPHPTMIYGEYNESEFKSLTRDSMESKLREAGIDTDELELHVGIGDPGTEVAEFAVQNKATLIVIPSHGRRGMGRVLLGSVTERVVRLAHCDVLVLKGSSV